MFSLIWQTLARAMFTGLWKQADSSERPAIANALHRILLQLTTIPDIAGESRDRGRRIIHEAPLGMIYRVDSQKMRVRILAVWTF